jgi:two-component system chemotaxis response regulator CheB
VIALGQRKAPAAAQRPQAAPALSPRPNSAQRPRIIAIGSSTGGPQALLTMLGALPPSVDCPIVIAQHMPATFTTVLAQHLARASNRPCAEAADGMEIKPGMICLAPGDYHLQVARQGAGLVARLSQTPPENFCRPSVDPLFRSVAQLFGAESCAVILTGMGSDGCNGARAMAAAGAPIIAQDEATSVVWGMPGAVANAGICSAILPLPRIAPHLASLCAKDAA